MLMRLRHRDTQVRAENALRELESAVRDLIQSSHRAGYLARQSDAMVMSQNVTGELSRQVSAIQNHSQNGGDGNVNR